MLKPLHEILKNPLARILLGMFMIAALTGAYAFKKSGILSPGRLSARHSNNTPMQGYVSHAEFEMQCSHCHAPLHCLTDDKCQSCHQEIARERSTADGLHALLPGTDDCETCHVEHRGEQAIITQVNFANINHEKLTGFSLVHHMTNFDGEKLDCHSCHPGDSYGASEVDCLSCHFENNHDDMAARVELYGTDCLSCHDGIDRMDEFAHEQVYILDGMHAEADCAGCHAEYTFAGTPSDCAACHEEPELHAGIFGDDCARCHTALAWAPAQLVQHDFVLAHGSEDIASCETCHAGTYTEYPCFSCHTEQEMADVHRQHSVYEDLSDCVACHPTGREGEVVAASRTSFLSAGGY